MSKVYKTPFMVTLPDFENIELMAVGDFHIGDKFYSQQILDDIVTWVKAKKNRYITINGDILNCGLKNSVTDVYSEQISVDEAIDVFSNFIDKVGKDKILCVTSGNHDQRLWKEVGIDPLRYVCNVKGVNYSSDEAFITIKVGHHKSNPKKKVTYRLYMIHGCGGGGTAGAKINAAMKMRDIVSADVYLMAHVHQPMVHSSKVYEFSSQANSIVEQTRWYVISGSCLERGGYPINKMYPPVSNWSPILTLNGREKKISARLEEE